MHDLVCKPSAGKRHARFDERLLETDRWLGLRHWRSAKAASNSFPHCPYLHRASSRLYLAGEGAGGIDQASNMQEQ